MSNNISLLDLPFHILIKIFTNLDISDLRNVMTTCKTLKNAIISTNVIWRSLFQNKLIIRNSTDKSQSITRSMYNQCRISHNWCKGIYRSKVFYYGEKYMPWLNYYNSQALLLSTGSALCCHLSDKNGFLNKNIQWNLEVPIVKRNDIRTNDISRFIVKHNLIACGNRDGSAAIYKVNDIRQKPQFLHHIRDCHKKGQVEVTGVELMNKDSPILITVSYDISELQYWNLNVDGGLSTNSSFLIADNLSSNTGIRCVAANKGEDKLALGLKGNSNPYVIDFITGQLLWTLGVTKGAVRDIQWHDENSIAFITYSGVILVIDIRMSREIFIGSDTFGSSLYCIKTDGDKSLLVGAAEYSRCVLFDLRKSLRHTQVYFTQRAFSPVYSLDFDSTRLIAAADRSVAVLNYNVNSATTRLRDYSQPFKICS